MFRLSIALPSADAVAVIAPLAEMMSTCDPMSEYCGRELDLVNLSHALQRLLECVGRDVVQGIVEYIAVEKEHPIVAFLGLAKQMEACAAHIRNCADYMRVPDAKTDQVEHPHGGSL